MADLLGLVAFPTFIVVSLVVGVRLVALARRTRQLPELAIGLNFLLSGALGYSLLVAAEALKLLPAPLDRAGSFAGVCGISAGAALIALFAQRVFRPGSAAARAMLAAIWAALALGVVGSWALHVARADDGAGTWLGHWAPNLGILASYAWCGGESMRFHAQLRRRARLGVADPLVANRLLLWGLGTLSIAGVATLHLVAQLLGHYELPPVLVGVTSLLVLVTAVCEWLAFFPPASYLGRFATGLPSAR